MLIVLQLGAAFDLLKKSVQVFKAPTAVPPYHLQSSDLVWQGGPAQVEVDVVSLYVASFVLCKYGTLLSRFQTSKPPTVSLQILDP